MPATSESPQNEQPQRAALYLRVSTGRQAEADLSIPDWRRQALSYCALGCRHRVRRAWRQRHR